MAITNLNELCRLCLDQSETPLYPLDSDFCILVMESGASVTISDAMQYLAMEIKITGEKQAETENSDDAGDKSETDEPKPDEAEDNPNLPKSLCQECLEKLQSAYEFKFRCEENRSFLRNYLKECADTKLAEERAAKEAALAALDIDIDNLDSLPDKLVLKQIVKQKKPRKPRDPTKPPVIRKRRIPEKNVIIAEDSQVDSAAYVRKMVTTPEQSPDQKRVSKRKSKHVIIEDILVGEKAKKISKENENISNINEKSTNESGNEKEKETKAIRHDDEPIFEDDDDFEEDPEPKRSKRTKK